MVEVAVDTAVAPNDKLGVDFDAEKDTILVASSDLVSAFVVEVSFEGSPKEGLEEPKTKLLDGFASFSISK